MEYKSKFKAEDVDELFKAILKLENLEECYRFFDDLMTIKEIQAAAQRWEVARLLNEGHTYAEIEKQTSASTATISRINKCIEYGAEGYKIVLDRMKED